MVFYEPSTQLSDQSEVLCCDYRVFWAGPQWICAALLWCFPVESRTELHYHQWLWIQTYCRLTITPSEPRERQTIIQHLKYNELHETGLIWTVIVPRCGTCYHRGTERCWWVWTAQSQCWLSSLCLLLSLWCRSKPPDLYGALQTHTKTGLNSSCIFAKVWWSTIRVWTLDVVDMNKQETSE